MATDNAKLVEELRQDALSRQNGLGLPHGPAIEERAATALASAEALNERLVTSLKELLPILTAVRHSVGLGKNQLERMERARALLASIEKGDGR